MLPAPTLIVICLARRRSSLFFTQPLSLSSMSAPREKTPSRRSTSKSRKSLDESRRIPTFELQGSAESVANPVDVCSPTGVDDSMLMNHQVSPHLLRLVHPRFLHKVPDQPEMLSRQISEETESRVS